MKLIVVLSLSLLLAGTAMSMEYLEDIGDGDPCSLCKEGLKDLDPILLPKLKGLVEGLLGDACDAVPIPKCKWLTGKIAGYGYKFLKKYLNHDELCKFVRVCEGESASYYSPEDFDLSDESTACIKCQLLVNKAKQAVADKKQMLNEVVMATMRDCEDELDDSDESCTDLVGTYGVQLVDNLIRNFPEFEVCSEMC